jgi:hypothetical protein
MNDTKRITIDIGKRLQSTAHTQISLCALVLVGGGSDRHFCSTRPLTHSILVLLSFSRMSMGFTLTGGGVPSGNGSFESVHPVRENRLRVFRRTPTVHRGRGVGQEPWWRVGPSAKDAARCVSLWDAMRTRTAWCARAPQRWTKRLSTHLLLTLPEGRPRTNTRNQVSDTWRVHLGNLTLPWVWPRRPGDV